MIWLIGVVWLALTAALVALGIRSRTVRDRDMVAELEAVWRAEAVIADPEASELQKETAFRYVKGHPISEEHHQAADRLRNRR